MEATFIVTFYVGINGGDEPQGAVYKKVICYSFKAQVFGKKSQHYLLMS